MCGKTTAALTIIQHVEPSMMAPPTIRTWPSLIRMLYRIIHGTPPELELSRAHTPCAASASIWELQEQHWLIYMYVFVDDLYLCMLGQLCTWAESTWLAVSAVNRRGQQNALFVMPMGHTKGIEAYWTQFLPILTDSLCLQVTQIPRSRNVAIFVVMMMTDKTNCFTPCACTWGNEYTSQLRTIHGSSVLADACDWHRAQWNSIISHVNMEDTNYQTILY